MGTRPWRLERGIKYTAGCQRVLWCYEETWLKKHLLVIEALKLSLCHCFVPLKELKEQNLDHDEPRKAGTQRFVK